MRICTFVLTALFEPDHPDFGEVNHLVYCYLCFPALGKKESISKVGSVLKEAHLRLLKMEHFSILDRPEDVTGDPDNPR